MKTIIFFFISLSCYGQCQSVILIKMERGVRVVDNYGSGMYRWFNVHGDTVMYVTGDSKIPEQFVEGSMWVEKYCYPQPLTNPDEGMNLIYMYQRHRNDKEWVRSNTILLKEVPTGIGVH